MPTAATATARYWYFQKPLLKLCERVCPACKLATCNMRADHHHLQLLNVLGSNLVWLISVIKVGQRFKLPSYQTSNMYVSYESNQCNLLSPYIAPAALNCECLVAGLPFSSHLAINSFTHLQDPANYLCSIECKIASHSQPIPPRPASVCNQSFVTPRRKRSREDLDSELSSSDRSTSELEMKIPGSRLRRTPAWHQR